MFQKKAGGCSNSQALPDASLRELFTSDHATDQLRSVFSARICSYKLQPSEMKTHRCQSRKLQNGINGTCQRYMRQRVANCQKYFSACPRIFGQSTGSRPRLRSWSGRSEDATCSQELSVTQQASPAVTFPATLSHATCSPACWCNCQTQHMLPQACARARIDC